VPANTSATGGFLLPSSTPPLNDQQLEDFFQAWVVGLTGYAPANVRPSWQVNPGNIPLNDVDWCSFKVSVSSADTFAVNLHYSAGQGYNQLRRHQVLTVRFSFWGPNASSYADLLRDGGAIPQNLEVFQLQSMGLIGFDDQVTAPEIVKNLWYRRVDMEMRVKRQIVRNYQVLTIEAAQLILDNEIYRTTINVTQP
jgi:hypothetical protein